MIFTETSIMGAFIIDLDPFRDDRGFFARTFCEREFHDHGLVSRFVQCSFSQNVRRGVLRGLHYQTEPHGETKLVRCTSGTIYSVIADLRPDSPTFKRWTSFELSQKNALSIYVPACVANGFQALTDGAEVAYQISEFYHPESARGIRWDDPALGVEWPIMPPFLSERDAGLPNFNWGAA
ncbi:MAG TPA: dTDP-4-dehydrorhamnose 3,5-epimerase [Bryobacteraceae bacterium]|jgi:dTDP-4-dehydrorhamnose 3,5-epimerase|nr:dTDP-4-dehydrorhamnose 3,5-epimerase [Bryobacteraceae bacterium]